MNRKKIAVPVIAGDYVNVFCPEPRVYPGPDGKELKKGRFYETWVPNDHCFVRGKDGGWHLFGITHPLTSVENVHEGEVQLFHAKTTTDIFKEITPRMFSDLGCILPPDERPDEPKEIHSPYLVEIGGVYHMIYGPKHFRLAKSHDLASWELKGDLFYDGEGDSRDPQVMIHDDTYCLCYCSGHEVRMRTSPDFYHWSDPATILVMPETVCPESPFLLNCGGIFYLFVCFWDWRDLDRREETLETAYQHKTQVFAAERIEELPGSEPVTVLEAHAPEIVQSGNGFFISSAEWPSRGINLARLHFSTP